MELKDPKDFPMVAVVWADSTVPASGGWTQLGLSDLRDESLNCYTVGFLIAENKQRIIVCGSYYENGEDNIGALGSAIIPKCSIIQMVHLQKKPPTKKKSG